MALFAPAAELTFVPVILAVAGHTGRRQLVAIEVAGVACIAFDFGVAASQRKFSHLVVIEVNRAPFILVVAGLALGAVSSAMSVLDPVAVNACRADPLVPLANMARGAEDRAMCPLKWELGLVMVERLDPSPRRLDMAIVT